MSDIKFEFSEVAINGLSQLRYSFINEEKIDIPFDISPIEYVSKTYSNTTTYIHSHSFYNIIWFLEGEGVHIFNFKEFKVKTNTIYMLAPSQIHQFQNLNNIKGYTISFTEDFLQHLDPSIILHIKYGLFYQFNNQFEYTISHKTSSVLENIVSAMIEEYNSSEVYALRLTYLASLFTLFVLTILRASNSTKINPNDESYDIFINFINKIDNNFCRLHTVKDYISLLNIPLSVLANATHKHGLTTPLKLINARILLEAKRLLRYSPSRIKEISAYLGFEDPSYFVKFFKRNIGMTPADYREQ